MTDKPSETQAQTQCRKKPIVILTIGLAGSGKTSFVQRSAAHLIEKGKPPYVVNLDPAVQHVPYVAHIDVRDTVKYKKLLDEYGLGPNGGLLTSVNLFATKFDQVLQICEKRADEFDYFIVDTPGQIEVFTWSASGQIIAEGFASQFPTVIAFIMDTARCTEPRIFMSNMLQACSVLYKFRLPMILVYNKCDIARHEFALKWMEDFQDFQEALSNDDSYAATLSRSLSLVLDEFYGNLASVGVSSMTGSGMDDFFKLVDNSVEEFENNYWKELQQRKQAWNKVQSKEKKDQMDEKFNNMKINQTLDATRKDDSQKADK